jgi:hypothetical protein
MSSTFTSPICWIRSFDCLHLYVYIGMSSTFTSPISWIKSSWTVDASHWYLLHCTKGVSRLISYNSKNLPWRRQYMASSYDVALQGGRVEPQNLSSSGGNQTVFGSAMLDRYRKRQHMGCFYACFKRTALSHGRERPSEGRARMCRDAPAHKPVLQ